MNEILYEKLIKELLQDNSDIILSIFGSDIVPVKRDSFYGSEIFICVNDEDSYDIRIFDKDSNETILVSEIETLKEAVKKLNKMIK